MFDHAVPLDPMQGDPCVWARTSGCTLMVFALHVHEDGGYEMQSCARTRIPEEPDSSDTRCRDGTVLRSVNGTLYEVM